LPPSFVVHSLQIAADMRLVHASLGGKIPAASCCLYLFPPPNGLMQYDDTNAPNYPARFYVTSPQ